MRQMGGGGNISLPIHSSGKSNALRGLRSRQQTNVAGEGGKRALKEIKLGSAIIERPGTSSKGKKGRGSGGGVTPDGRMVISC